MLNRDAITAELRKNTSILSALNVLKEWQIKGHESDQKKKEKQFDNILGKVTDIISYKVKEWWL